MASQVRAMIVAFALSETGAAIAVIPSLECSKRGLRWWCHRQEVAVAKGKQGKPGSSDRRKDGWQASPAQSDGDVRWECSHWLGREVAGKRVEVSEAWIRSTE